MLQRVKRAIIAPMAQLSNVRHENFCKLVIDGAKLGWTQGEIYQRAGYKARGHSAEQLGSQLLKNVEIQQRIAELTAPAVRKAKLTAESLIAKLDDVYTGAVASEQYGAARGAIETQAKIAGLMIDRTEIGAPGEFAGLSEVQVVELIRAELGEEAVALLLASLDSEAEIVIEHEPSVGIDVGIDRADATETQ
jgi:Terminase small subunit